MNDFTKHEPMELCDQENSGAIAHQSLLIFYQLTSSLAKIGEKIYIQFVGEGLNIASIAEHGSKWLSLLHWLGLKLSSFVLIGYCVAFDVENAK